MSALGLKGQSRSKRDSNTSTKAPLVGDSKPPEPFVNTGLEYWKREHEKWVTRPPGFVRKTPQQVSPQTHEAQIEEIHHALVISPNCTLPRKIPLSQLIEILQDVRELE